MYLIDFDWSYVPKKLYDKIKIFKILFIYD